MREPRGAGRSGGLLFLAVGLFVLYMVISGVVGILKFIIGVALVVVLGALALNVLRRR